jgi:hypothetical protein
MDEDVPHAFRAGQEYVLCLLTCKLLATQKNIMNNVYAYLRRSSLIIPWFSETYRTHSEASADFFTKKRQEKDRILVKVFEV